MTQYRSIQHALCVTCFICHMILRCDMGSKSGNHLCDFHILDLANLLPPHLSPSHNLSAALPHIGVFRLLMPQRRVAVGL